MDYAAILELHWNFFCSVSGAFLSPSSRTFRGCRLLDSVEPCQKVNRTPHQCYKKGRTKKKRGVNVGGAYGSA